jgi:hypothetical protein
MAAPGGREAGKAAAEGPDTGKFFLCLAVEGVVFHGLAGVRVGHYFTVPDEVVSAPCDGQQMLLGYEQVQEHVPPASGHGCGFAERADAAEEFFGFAADDRWQISDMKTVMFAVLPDDLAQSFQVA